MTRTPHQVVVIGGGIAGLSTAFALHERARALDAPLECTVLEASSRYGGKIFTHRMNDLVIEGGPDSFLSSKPWGIELCEKLGLSNELIGTNEAARQTFIYSRGRLRELPQGLVALVPTKLGPLLRSGLMSSTGLLRMGADLFVRTPPPEGDESLASFFRRRFGQEALSRIVEPLVAGIYAGDAEQLSILATFPRFRELEQRHGSLLRGVLAERRKPARSSMPSSRPASMFLTLRNGLGDLVQALEASLHREGVKLWSGCRVSAVRPHQGETGGGYSIHLEHGPALPADVVVLATPAFNTASLIRPFCPSAADRLAAIPYTSTATVSLVYRQDEVADKIRGFGFVVPRVEKRRLLAATWTSSKWSHRAPPGRTLVRCYTGGMGREGLLEQDDASLVEDMGHELRELAGIHAQPLHAEVYRWDHGMPQYTVGHLDHVQAIHEELRGYGGLYVTGAAYGGVGIPDCIRGGFETADQVVKALSRRAKTG